MAQAKGVDVISKDELVYTLNTPDFTPMSVAAYGSLVAVGTDQNKIGESVFHISLLICIWAMHCSSCQSFHTFCIHFGSG